MASTDDSELEEIYRFAVQLGKDAGSMLQKAAEARFDGGSSQIAQLEKESAVDIVTQTDEGQYLVQVVMCSFGMCCDCR